MDPVIKVVGIANPETLVNSSSPLGAVGALLVPVDPVMWVLVTARPANPYTPTHSSGFDSSRGAPDSEAPSMGLQARADTTGLSNPWAVVE